MTQPLVHSDAVFQRERSKRCANELLFAMFRAQDFRVLRRGPLRVSTAPATKAPSWCCHAGFSTAERYAELDHCGPGGFSRHSPSRRRSVNLDLVQTEKIFPRLSCWHLAHPSASPNKSRVSAARSLLGFSFLSHPLSYVWRTVHDLHPVGLARSQESNYLDIDDRYFLQVQNQPGSVILELLFQFPDMLRLKVTNQTNGGPAAVRIPFDLQVRSPRLKRHSSWVNASGVPTQLIESAALTAQEIVEVSGNPESSENRASFVAVRDCRSDGRELMRRERCRAYGTGNTRIRANR